jgi:hypothetical protein
MDVRRKELRNSLRTDFNPSTKLRLRRLAFRVQQLMHLPALLAGGDVKEPIFLVGAPRSGSSLLYAILRTSSRLAHWPGEAHEVWEADYHPALRGWESNVLGIGDIERDAAERIRRAFFLVTGPRKRLIDKTPRNSLRLGFVNSLFPDARFVLLHRDGRDNVNSLINAWRTPRYRTYRLPRPHSIPGTDPNWWKFVLYPGWQEDTKGPLETVCAKQWKFSNDFILRDSEQIDEDRRVSIYYERMVAAPVDEVERIFEFLGLPCEDKVREAARRAKSTPINVVTPPESGKWKRENPHEIEAVVDLIKPTMVALGYAM